MSNDTRSIQVLIRFFLRIAVLSVFAALGSVGFTRSMAALLWLSAILCAVAGSLRREALFGSSLTHWDEGVAYAALYCLTSAFNIGAVS
jgi:hypothetical protein